MQIRSKMTNIANLSQRVTRNNQKRNMKRFSIARTTFLILLLALQASCSHHPKQGEAGEHSEYETSQETTQSEEDLYVHPAMFEGGDIFVSEDGRVTIESGICPGSGTATTYWAIWTYTDEKNEKHEFRIPDSPGICQVHSIQRKDGSTYYLVKCFAKASGADGYHWVEAYTLQGGALQQVNVIDFKVAEDPHTFGVNYCIPDWYFTTYGAGYDWIYEYDPATRKMYVPIACNQRITDRYHVWQFDGNKFIPLGEHPHKGLHPSLCSYDKLVQYATTLDYIVRVDRVAGDRLRYASWRKPKTLSDKPDLIIYKPDDSYDDGNLIFRNGPYEYDACYTENYPSQNGRNRYKDFLVVRKNGKIILKQEIII